MRGLMYKELHTNRVFILAAPGAVAGMMLFPFLAALLMKLTGQDEAFFESLFADEGAEMLMMFFALMGVYIAGMMESMVLQADERKKWTYFVASTPQGARGQVFYKYVIILLMSCLWLGAFFFMEGIYMSLRFFVSGEQSSSMIGLMVSVLYIQLMMWAVEMPFAIRFGTEMGSKVRFFALGAVFFGIVVYLLFGPLPSNFGELMDKVFAFVMNLRDGNVPEWVILVQALFPYAAVGLYVLSYRISCRMYLKGAEQYDK